MILSRTTQPAQTRLLGGLFVLSGIIALGMVWYAEHRLQLAPCELCLWERRPWRVLIGAGALTLILPKRFAKYGVFVGLLCLMTSIGLAVLHSGVEHGWWPSPAPECRAPVFHGGSFKDWMASMPARPNKPCDAPDYLFGLPISMTETGGLYAIIVFVLAAFGSVRMLRSRR
ncbi:disulfide bond formation protein B [Gluconobacter morbifer]|uniref:Disulfide bond formation protein B n=1 Tax=Gluconobacter morbifer G707 TaxID=1088869 RepID=G6XKK1_9PROT|nr:disulfide bond formation protein B [Gluconobacter morbifer]EHH67797.1 disulfide bond formation protein B [Gluconobacter morbifer G707]